VSAILPVGMRNASITNARKTKASMKAVTSHSRVLTISATLSFLSWTVLFEPVFSGLSGGINTKSPCKRTLFSLSNVRGYAAKQLSALKTATYLIMPASRQRVNKVSVRYRSELDNRVGWFVLRRRARYVLLVDSRTSLTRTFRPPDHRSLVTCAYLLRK
jgi:3-polyprenyl-4-hydroxybenzoate decarboxylase